MARTFAEPSCSSGISPEAGRPLFVPPGIARVRTGPTTPAELDRLLSDSEPEHSVVRLTPAGRASSFRALCGALGFSPSFTK